MGIIMNDCWFKSDALLGIAGFAAIVWSILPEPFVLWLRISFFIMGIIIIIEAIFQLRLFPL
jgi:hypothetical protein